MFVVLIIFSYPSYTAISNHVVHFMQRQPTLSTQLLTNTIHLNVSKSWVLSAFIIGFSNSFCGLIVECNVWWYQSAVSFGHRLVKFLITLDNFLTEIYNYPPNVITISLGIQLKIFHHKIYRCAKVLCAKN